MKKLMGRYLGKDVKELFHSKRTKLPVSGTNVDIIYHDARDCVVSLLTDPRFTDDDFQHFGNDPLAPPPDNLQTLGDTSTGRAYSKTYCARNLSLTPRNRCLCPS